MYQTFHRRINTKTERGISSLFPVPDFLSMTALGFDISDDSIKTIELLKRNGTYQVGLYNTTDIPKGTIGGGDILNPVRLQEVVSSIQRRFKIGFVNASLPEQKSYLFITTAKGDSSTIRQSIEFQLEENVPLSAAEAVFDYDVFRAYRKQGEEHKDVRVTVMSRSLSEAYSSLLRRSGLRPLSLTVESEAVARAVIPEGSEGTYMIVDMGKARTGISIVSEGVVMYTSTIEVGGNYLTESLSKNLGMSFEEAEEKKQSHGLLAVGESAEISNTLRDNLKGIISQIEHHLRYWHSQVDEKGIYAKRVNLVVLCGGGSLMRGLPSEFKSVFNIDAELANVWSNVPFRENYIPEITFEESLSYATAIGLALNK